MMSGKRENSFSQGWCVWPWVNRAHYMVRDELGLAKSLCGLERPAGGLFGQGGYPFCKRCSTALARLESEAGAS